jgi:uncharacterized protein Yka (UPF0111/DUF47 family)
MAGTYPPRPAIPPEGGSLLRAARDRHAELVDSVAAQLTTPVDPSDLFAVGEALLSVVASIERARATIEAIRPASLPEDVPAQTRLLTRATWRLADAVYAVRQRSDPSNPRAEIRAIERVGDRIVRSAAATLFHSGAEPAEIVRQKEILDVVEAAIDSVRSASSVVVRLDARAAD